MDKDQIENLADLSRVDISNEEKDELGNELQSVLDYVGQIQEVTTNDTLREAGEHKNVMRDDTDPYPKGSFTENIMEEAPDTKDGYLRVKKIL